MAYVNYQSVALRASAATAGGSEQDAAVTLPETVTEFWAVLTKTAEANADNLLTARIQAQVGSTWFDLAWDWIQTTQTLTVATDIATNTSRVQNIVVSDSTAPTYSVLAYYSSMPSNVLRVASVSSGTTVANTFSVTALFALNRL